MRQTFRMRRDDEFISLLLLCKYYYGSDIVATLLLRLALFYAYCMHTHQNTHLSPVTHSHSTDAKAATSITDRIKKKCEESNTHRNVNRVIADALEFYCPQYEFRGLHETQRNRQHSLNEK